MSAVQALAAAMLSRALSLCKELNVFFKREQHSTKRLESTSVLPIKTSIDKKKWRSETYGKQGLLCSTDSLPNLIMDGDQAQWGELITPGLLFLYIACWISWVGRSYLIAIRSDKKPTQKEIIIDIPLASHIIWRGFIWPVTAANEFLSGHLIEDDANVTVSRACFPWDALARAIEIEGLQCVWSLAGPYSGYMPLEPLYVHAIVQKSTSQRKHRPRVQPTKGRIN